jgi:hypothetical protein
MTSYIEYVNREHKLLPAIDNLAEQKYNYSVNDEYEPVTKKAIDDIFFLVYIIKKEIVPQLPSSKAYVASFSMLENEELVLWDIYGKWYYR